MPATAEGVGVRLRLDQLQDLGMVVEPLHVGMQVDAAPAPGEGEELLRRQVLAAEEDHLMLEERLVDFAVERVGQRLRQVGAFDLRAQRPRDPVDADRLVGTEIPELDPFRHGVSNRLI